MVTQQTTLSILWGTCTFGLTFLFLAPQRPYFCLYVKVVCSASLYTVSLQSCKLQSFHADKDTRHLHNCLFLYHQVLWCICLSCLWNTDGIGNSQSDVLPSFSLWNILDSHYNTCCPQTANYSLLYKVHRCVPWGNILVCTLLSTWRDFNKE